MQLKLFLKKKDDNATYSSKLIYDREIGILKQLQDNENIVKLLDYKETRSDYYIVMQLCQGGSLMKRISTSNVKYQITEKIGAELIKTMLNCVEYCHSKNIVHCDLKPGMYFINIYKYLDINNT